MFPDSQLCFTLSWSRVLILLQSHVFIFSHSHVSTLSQSRVSSHLKRHIFTFSQNHVYTLSDMLRVLIKYCPHVLAQSCAHTLTNHVFILTNQSYEILFSRSHGELSSYSHGIMSLLYPKIMFPHSQSCFTLSWSRVLILSQSYVSTFSRTPSFHTFKKIYPHALTVSYLQCPHTLTNHNFCRFCTFFFQEYGLCYFSSGNTAGVAQLCHIITFLIW
jgi:hypothetical protein